MKQRSLPIFLLMISALLGGSQSACQNTSSESPETNIQQAAPFEATWDSLQQYSCPEWFRDAKFGIYVHWGVYSVPAQGCWYGRNMYDRNRPEYQYHRDNWGHPSEFGYKDFIPLWKAENFDPDSWLSLFKEAGARYFTPCASHHDGFDLWDSPHKYNAVNMGPQKNLLRMLKDATLEHGLRWGVTTHLARNYNFFQPGYGSDPEGPYKGIPYIQDTLENREFYHPHHGDINPKYPRNPSESWKESWSARLKDLIDRYDPDLLYFDGAVPFDIDDGLTGRRILAHYYNRGLIRHTGKNQVVLTIKTARDGHGIYHEGIATLDLERHRLDSLRPDPWQTDDTIGVRYWSYAQSMAYRPVDELIDTYVDIVSKNGNLLLNVPPRADGTFEDETIRILKEIGMWNRQNGEAIFGTRPWIRFGEDAVRFTRSQDGQILYAIFLNWPGQRRTTLKSLATSENVIKGKILSVTVLGSSAALEFEHDARGLHLILGEPANAYATALKIKIQGNLILQE